MLFSSSIKLSSVIVHIWSSVMNQSVENKDISLNRTKNWRKNTETKTEKKEKHQKEQKNTVLDSDSFTIWLFSESIWWNFAFSSQAFFLHPKCDGRHISWIPWNLSFRYMLFHENWLQTMLWHQNAGVNSHQRWKQTRFCVCFHLWRELTSTMNRPRSH